MLVLRVYYLACIAVHKDTIYFSFNFVIINYEEKCDEETEQGRERASKCEDLESSLPWVGRTPWAN